MRFTQTLLFALVALLLFSTCNDPAPEEKFLNALVYNEQTMSAELAYLNTIDISTLTELQKAAVTTRRGELEKIGELLEDDPGAFINMVRCIPGQPRDPPGPCPVPDEALSNLPTNTAIERDLLGHYTDEAEAANPEARILANQGTAQLVTPDGKKIFAQGSFNSYDSLFHTVWYQFEVEKKALASGPLILRITTQVIVNQQLIPVTIEKPIPAGTFLGDKIY
ncbi:MAG TPA: hypothetical protein VFG46_01875 [Chryseolinea sp.]|nr:hypothetical protein [Chryseolinea sp.]